MGLRIVETDSDNASNQMPDILEQLLKPEVQESLSELIEQLPKLTQVVNDLTKCYDLVQSIATDEVLKNDTIGAITEMTAPIKSSVKNVAASAIEAKERAETSGQEIGVFGLLKMLKEPQMQKMLRFMNAFLQVSEERARPH